MLDGSKLFDTLNGSFITCNNFKITDSFTGDWS